MIILDEQLLEHDIEANISKWYGGAVRFVTELRPNTIIKDDAIPQLLRQQNQATFITINEKDFWRKVAISEQFCVVCLTLLDSRTHEIPELLRGLWEKPGKPICFNNGMKGFNLLIRCSSGFSIENPH